MKHRIRVGTGVVLALILGIACGESREEQLKRQLGYTNEKTERKPIEDASVPAHPDQDELRPLLSKIYSHERIPGVVEEDILPQNPRYPYELQAGVLSVVKIPKGASKEEKMKAIILGTAEADAWVFRKTARRDYAQLIHKVKYGFGDETKEQILRGYADLKLLSFFNSPEADAAIGELQGDAQKVAKAMKDDYVTNRDKYWGEWMAVKMYARRAVSGDEPYRSLLRQLAKDLGTVEVKPRSFQDSVDAPFKQWAAEIEKNEELLIKLTNYRELRERVDFLGDTHAVWAIEGSDLIPEKAKGLKPEKSTGYAVLREDLGSGYNELTFVFDKKLSGAKLKRAFLHSLIYRQLLTDFQLLATAGGDWAERNPDGTVVNNTSIVPDEYDPLYARCGADGALDSLIIGFSGDFPILNGVPVNQKNPEKIISDGHKCVVEGGKPKIYVPAKDDEFDMEGPAPASRLALFQMLARFEKIDVNMAGMGDDAKRTEEDDAIDDAEKLLKELKKKQEAEKKARGD
ncbi:MAG: hypothetical protein KC420_03360 [Myxococcales bacterium]|nr:hypothetical protein [Myxococcales bacterium]MCB9569440.1 hypothetical protein [Myxococcales bacterium]MCB9706229.1 hypothetical protein [Myxococcales bacterium]